MRALALVLVTACSVADAQPPASLVPESTWIPLPRFISLATYNVAEPTKTGTIVNVDAFGAVGDGVADDGAAIAAAFAAAPSGSTIVFTAGKTYRKTGMQTLSTANVTLWGYGAVIYADFNGAISPDLAFKLAAANDAAYGLAIISNLDHRPTNTSSAGLWVTGDGATLIDDRIEYTGTGVFVQSTHAFVGRNDVYRTRADGISFAGGAACGCAIDHGIIAGNIVRQNGDDQISLVNYADTDDQAPFLANVLVEGNDVGDGYGGNGIAAHGGDSITIRNNHVGPVPCNSGITVDSQAGGFELRNANNVLVTGNTLVDIETSAATYQPSTPCVGQDHGALYVQAAGGHHVTNVLFMGNSVTRAAKRGGHVQENGAPSGIVTGVGFTGLRAVALGETEIQSTTGSAVCSDNQVTDDHSIVGVNCAAGAMPTVTGSAYTSR